MEYSDASDIAAENTTGMLVLAGAVVLFAGVGILWARQLGEFQVMLFVALLAAAAMLSIIFIQPFVGLCLMAFLVPLEGIKSLAGEWMSITKPIGIVTFACFLANSRLRQKALRFDRQSKWIVAFALWMALSVLWARNRQPVFVFASSTAQIALFWILMRASLTSRENRMIISLCFVVGTLAAVLISSVMPRWGFSRLIYTSGNPNHLARDIVVSLILVIYYAPVQKSWFFLMAVAAGGVLILGLALTQTRAAWLAALICLPIVLLGHKKSLSAVSLVGMAFLALVLFTMQVLSAHLGITETALENRAETMIHRESIRHARVDIWRAGIELARRSPIVGVGCANFVAFMPETLAGRADLDIPYSRPGAHNAFICVLAELGIVGLIILLAVLWQCIRLTWSLPRSPEKMLALSLICFGLIRMTFATAHYEKTLWFALGLSQAFSLSILRRMNETDDDLEDSPAHEVVGLEGS